MPQTKSQIDNFADGQSFHGWQLKIGLPIGISLAVIFGFIGLIWYWKSDKKRKPYEIKGKKQINKKLWKK